MLIERSESAAERVERTRKMGETEREGEKVHMCGREKERGKIRGRARERILVSGSGGLCEGFEGWCAKVTAKQAAVRRTERARG